MGYIYDKNKIKESLSLEQIYSLLESFNADPVMHGDYITSLTICHGGDSHKLYYYDNTHLFRCYTGCETPVFDVFELVLKIKSRQEEYQLHQAIEYIANFFGFSHDVVSETNTFNFEDWNIFKKYDRIKNINTESQRVELKIYEADFLRNLPRPLIEPWLNEFITKDVMDFYEICYDPVSCGIVIPHRDINGNLIGIRERTLIEETAEKYGKYLPMRFNGQMYNHPLSFSLFGIYQNQSHIQKFKKAFVFESEKSVLQYGSLFGQDNNLAVACCGSSFIQYQAWLLISLGVTEIIVGLDKQYKELNDDEHKKLVRNLKQIHNKYGHYVTISYLFDKENILDYKDSPTDKGKESFLYLYNNRVNLY